MNFNTIFRRGINKVNKRFDKRRVIFANVTFVLVFFGTFGAFFAASTFELELLAVVTMMMAVVLYMLHGYYPKTVIKISGLYFQCVIFVHSSFLEPGQYIEYATVAMTGFLPVLFRKWWSFYFLVTNIFIFYYPAVILGVYESFFQIAFIPGLILYFIMLTFVRETEIYEQRLLNKQKELISLNSEKNSLIGIVAHDLKSPLSQIMGLINLISLSKNKLPEDTEEYILKISKSSEKMSKMISQILNTELIDNKKMILDLQPVHPSEIMREVITDFEILANEKGITVNEEFYNGNIRVLADKQCLLQAIQNLMSNAIKFSPFHTQIELSVELSNGKVRMKVADQGPGITEEDKSKLFKKYQQLSSKPTGGEDSTGLGLAIVKKFVNAMKGEIWCENRPDKGAAFIIEMDRV